MSRCFRGLLTVAWLAVTGLTLAADPVPSGNYKLQLVVQGQLPTLWLVKLDNKDGKLTGEVVSTRERVPPAKVTEVSVKDGILKLAMELKTKTPIKVAFEGKIPTGDAKKIYGTFTQPRELIPAHLELTTLKDLSTFETNKEILAQVNPGPEIFDAAQDVLNQAGEKKAKIEDVRNWANKAFKAAEPYGKTWQMETALEIAGALSKSEELAPVAVLYARQAERLLAASDTPGLQRRTLSALSAALTKSGKADEAKEIDARIEKIEAIPLAKFAGRKGKSDRVAMVELFTGAECPPCVAVDLGFDALGKTFKPKDVVLLQYHLHIPRADPLTNPDTEARKSYYGDDIEGTPTIFFNGKVQDITGGGYDEGQERYTDMVSGVEKILETPAKVNLKATAVQKGQKINITAEASDLVEPGKKVRLRLALVEEVVNYKGGNKLAQHHHVVRALPGGPAGLPLTEKSGKQTATVDLDEVRAKLKKYLDEVAKDLDFPNKERPMDLKKLSVIAFVQNDDTKEILQAVQVNVAPE